MCERAYARACVCARARTRIGSAVDCWTPRFVSIDIGRTQFTIVHGTTYNVHDVPCTCTINCTIIPYAFVNLLRVSCLSVHLHPALSPAPPRRLPLSPPHTHARAHTQAHTKTHHTVHLSPILPLLPCMLLSFYLSPTCLACLHACLPAAPSPPLSPLPISPSLSSLFLSLSLSLPALSRYTYQSWQESESNSSARSPDSRQSSATV